MTTGSGSLGLHREKNSTSLDKGNEIAEISLEKMRPQEKNCQILLRKKKHSSGRKKRPL